MNGSESETSDIDNTEAVPVAPGDLRVSRRSDGQFEAAWPGGNAVVRVVRCFPWSEPKRFISLRDGDDREIALVVDLEDVERATGDAILAALAEAAFALEITRIDSIEEEFEIRNWRVQTRQGPRTFQTHRDEWPRAIEGGGFLMNDVAGDLFLIPAPGALDEESRKRLRVYVD